MKGILAEIASMVKDFGSAPTFAEMPRKTLADKGIAGPTAAHTIEEVHTPLNLAYLTFTTGSSAFQNIVGITFAELPARVKASFTVLERAGLKAGDKVLVTYPPLVNVFSGEAFKKYGLQWEFLVRSSRDAFLAALYEFQPKAVVGESSFIRAYDGKHVLVKHPLSTRSALPLQNRTHECSRRDDSESSDKQPPCWPDGVLLKQYFPPGFSR